MKQDMYVDDILASLALSSNDKKSLNENNQDNSKRLGEGTNTASGENKPHLQSPLLKKTSPNHLANLHSKNLEVLLKNSLIVHRFNEKFMKDHIAAGLAFSAALFIAKYLPALITKTPSAGGALAIIPVPTFGPRDDDKSLMKSLEKSDFHYLHIASLAQSVHEDGLNEDNWPTQQEQEALAKFSQQILDHSKDVFFRQCEESGNPDQCI